VNHFSFSSLSNSCQSPYQFCSYINTKSLKTVTVGKTVLPALSEFYANAHLKTPEHSSWSSRIEQPTGRKDAFHIYACDAAAQFKSLTSRASREGPLTCQHWKY